MTWNDDQGPWGPSTGPVPSGDKKPEQPKNQGRGPNRNAGGPHNISPPPDLEELLRKIQDFLSPYKPQGHFQAVMLVLGLGIGLWLLSGFYMVAANQVGVVMRFGAYNRTEDPGLHYRLPTPFEQVYTPNVTSQNEIQIGFRNTSRAGAASIPEESMMLTQDENVINVQFTVFWRVADVKDYLFQIRNPELTVKMSAESAMREVIGQSKLQFALTEGRGQIAEDARKRLQNLVDEYKAGVVITQINLQTVAVPDEVKAAFQDVVNARLDMERFQNEAAAHVNKVIPESKGEAARLVQQAMAYRDQKIAVAQGDADRFKEVLTAYNSSRDVTSKRLYLETMESVLGNAQKVITDKGAGTVPLYPLQDVMRKNQSANEGASR